MKVTSASVSSSPASVVKSACTCTRVELVTDAPATSTSPVNRVVPVAFVIVSTPPTVRVPANVTFVALVIVRLPSTVTLPVKSTVVASVIVRSPPTSTAPPIEKDPASTTIRSSSSVTDCCRLTAWPPTLSMVSESNGVTAPIAPVTVIEVWAFSTRSAFVAPTARSMRPFELPKICT